MQEVDVLRAGPICVSLLGFACWVDGVPVDLTARQIALLAELVRARGALRTREALYLAVTGDEMPRGSRSIDMDLWRIRRALGPRAPLIRAVRKVGYALDTDAMEAVAATDS